MKFKTVREGQQAIILNHMGEGELVEGPRRVFLFRKRFQLLKQYSATSDEYLVIQEIDGTVSHKPGPCSLFHNPLVYQKIDIVHAIKLDANQVIVVYKQLPSNTVERRLVEGPSIVVPEAEEWLHEFVWHGTDPENKARMVPGSRKFTKLPVIPDHFYYNVGEVRTNDDTMITVKVMVFFVITDLLKMLDTTHDPIADIINALCADVITFASRLSYQQFVEQTTKLSSMETYSQLQHRNSNIGLTVDRVVYRGYHSTEQIQANQNRALESRTKLRLDTEMEVMQQKITSLKLDAEESRADLRQRMVRARQHHEQQQERMKQEHELQQSHLKHTHDLQLNSLETTADLESKREKDEQEMDYLTKLSALSVNITDYLVSQTDPVPSRQIRMAAKS